MICEEAAAVCSQKMFKNDGCNCWTRLHTHVHTFVFYLYKLQHMKPWQSFQSIQYCNNNIFLSIRTLSIIASYYGFVCLNEIKPQGQ